MDEFIKKQRSASYLLPDPGGEVVRNYLNLIEYLEESYYKLATDLGAKKKRIRELEQFCRATIRYAGCNGDDLLVNLAKKVLENNDE